MRTPLLVFLVGFLALAGALSARPPDRNVSKILKVMGEAPKLEPREDAEAGGFVNYFGGAKTVTPVKTVTGPAGNHFIAGNVSWQTTIGRDDLDVFLTKLDPVGNLVYTLYFGGDGIDQVEDIAIDSTGRVYLAGATNSANFPSVNALQPQNHGLRDGFACRLTPDGGFDYCTLLGGMLDDYAMAIAVDAAGAAYVAGTTYSGDYPLTPGAFQTTSQPPDNLGWPSDVFVTKLSPNGGSLVYSTYLGGRSTSCVGGSRCVGAASHDNARSIAVDGAGNAYIAGTTNSYDFPTTEGAYQRECHCDYFTSDLFVSKLNPTGSALVYSTYIGGRAPQQMTPEESLGAMALDPQGDVYLAGGTGSLSGDGGESYPTTPGAYQPDVSFEYTGNRTPAPFVTKLNATGSSLIYSTFLTGPSGGMANGLALGPNGEAYVVGTTQAADFPVTPGAFANGREFRSHLSADGATLLYSTQLPAGFGAEDIRIDAASGICLLGASAYLSCTADDPAQIPAILGLANSASSMVTGKITGGELVSLMGPAVGPETPVGLEIGPDGKVTAELGGTRVYFDGVPAPMLYAQKDFINCVVPAVLAASSPRIEVVHAGKSIGTLRLTRTSTQPGVFRRPSGRAVTFAAAINQDGTSNSEENPAPYGSIIAIYATGLGGVAPLIQDGEIAGEKLPRVLGRVRVLSNLGDEMEITYAGQAPELVAGVMQVNFRIMPRVPPAYPAEFTLFLQLEVDGVASEPFAIAAGL